MDINIKTKIYIIMIIIIMDMIMVIMDGMIITTVTITTTITGTMATKMVNEIVQLSPVWPYREHLSGRTGRGLQGGRVTQGQELGI